VVDESLDFFYVAPILDALGAPLPFPAPGVHPAELALFNGVNAWSLMFLGLLSRDARGALRRRAMRFAKCVFCSRTHAARACGGSAGVRLPLLGTWSGQMFLTNVFLLPWMAARAATPPADDDADADADADEDARLPAPLAALAASPALGLVGGAVGALSVVWFAAAPVPDAAGAADAVDLAARVAHLVDAASSDRLTLAFLVDCVVYSAAQAWLMGDERDAIEAAARAAGEAPPRLPPPWLRFVPFAGLAAWLVARPAAAEARGR
jgi:hypothetical protein